MVELLLRVFYSSFSNLFSALGATPRERFALADFSPTVARNGKETNGSCGATFQCLQRAWNAKGTRPGIVAWCYHTTHISQCRGKVFFCGAMRVPTIEWWKRFPFFIISCFFWHTYSGRERSKKTHTHTNSQADKFRWPPFLSGLIWRAIKRSSGWMGTAYWWFSGYVMVCNMLCVC